MKQNSKFALFTQLLVVLYLALLSSCVYDTEAELGGNEDCEFFEVSYFQDVLPIIESACYNCHGNGETLGGVNLDGYVNLASWAEDNLFCVINHDNGCSEMPKNQPQLPDCDILLIKSWIDEGAQNN